MTAKQIRLLRLAAWGPVFLALFLGPNWTSTSAVDRPDVRSGSAVAFEKDCSNQKNPTHVVVTTAKGKIVYGDSRWVDRAIEQSIYGIDHDLTIHAFCA